MVGVAPSELLTPSIRRKLERTLAEVRAGNPSPERRPIHLAIRERLETSQVEWGYMLPALLAFTIVFFGRAFFVVAICGASIAFFYASEYGKRTALRLAGAKMSDLALVRLLAQASPLTPVETIAFETAVGAPSNSWWDQELIATLQMLAEEDARLAEVPSLTVDRRFLEVERSNLKIQMIGCEDDPTKGAIIRTLTVIDRRLVLARAGEIIAKRIAAHRELLRQTALSAVETARSANQALTTPDFTELRANAKTLAFREQDPEAAVPHSIGA